MIDDLWSLPGPSRLLEEVATALSSGRSVVLVRPSVIRLQRLASALRARIDHDWVTLDCSELRDSGSLVERVHEHLGFMDEENPTPASLLEALDGRVVWVKPHRVEDAHALSSLISELAALRARRGRGLVFCACVAAPELDPIPRADTGLTVLWWWGRIGPLDTRVVVDAAMSERRVLGDVDAVAECATYSLDVADQLARGWTGDPSGDLSSILSPQTLAIGTADIGRATTRVASPPRALLTAWDAGHLDWWGDHVALHPACVMGDSAALARRVWRGHLASVLPFVEVRRQALGRWAADRRHLTASTMTTAEIADLECGPLLRFIRGERQLSGSRTAVNLGIALRDARNALAHLEPLDRAWLERNETLLATAAIT